MSKEAEKKAEEQQENITPASSEEQNQNPNTENETTNASGTDGDGTSGDEENYPDDEEDEAKVLVATAYILYNSKQYEPGDELPASDEGMVEAWVEAKTAAWINESAVRAKARPATALPGATGDAIHSESEDGENLVGRVPKTSNRRRK
jgi:hypothetical protein